MPEPNKRWKNVKIDSSNNIVYKNRRLETRWVRFRVDHEDGYAKWQAGQHIEWPYDREKLLLYLEDGICEPCDPKQHIPPKRDCTPFIYKFTESVAYLGGGYAPNQEYELPKWKGDKFVERGLASRMRSALPEPAETARTRKTEKAVK